jgi:hypothetical protein
MNNVANKIIDRLVEAVQTGAHCGTSDSGPRRVAAISLRGFDLLIKHGLLAVALRRVGEIETPHPRAQARFVRAWLSIGIVLREMTCDDRAFFAGLRVLLPPYDGPAVTLYRGQLKEHLGISWSSNFWVAEAYARLGCFTQRPRHGAILIRATIPPSMIISALGNKDEEYVVDPRWLKDFEVDEGEPQAAAITTKGDTK